MPIYAYRCTQCGFEKDVMQKISDPLLTACPKCQAETFAKQLTAPGFQLKGGGWYATDFKGSGSKPTDKPAEKPATTDSVSTAPCPSAAASSTSSGLS